MRPEGLGFRHGLRKICGGMECELLGSCLLRKKRGQEVLPDGGKRRRRGYPGLVDALGEEARVGEQGVEGLVGRATGSEKGSFACIGKHTKKISRRCRLVGKSLISWGRSAWQGCEMEALYSSTADGRLEASCASEEGRAFFEGVSGVDVYCDRGWFEALNCARFVPLMGSQAFWAAV